MYNIKCVTHSDLARKSYCSAGWTNLCKSVTDEINNLCNILQANQMLVELLIPEPQTRKQVMMGKRVLTEEEGVWRWNYLLSISLPPPKVIFGLDHQD